MKPHYTLVVLSVFLLGTTSNKMFAQDPHFSQFYANPIYLNPASAGAAICPRILLNYRNQWPAISGNFVTASASFDQYIPLLQGGLGFHVLNDRAGQATYQLNQAALVYAYHQKLSHRTKLQFGFQVMYRERRIDWDKLIFGDQIHPRDGAVLATQELRPPGSRGMLDFSSGLLVHNKFVFAGAAVHHLTEPDEAFIHLGESKLPVKYTLHGGMNFFRSHSSDVSLSPNILFQKQGDFKQLNVGMYVNRGPIVAGLWSRLIERDAVIIVLGIKGDMIRVGYSYDVTISGLGASTAGSHEFSMAIQFECKPKPVRSRPIICPSF